MTEKEKIKRSKNWTADQIKKMLQVANDMNVFILDFCIKFFLLYMVFFYLIYIDKRIV